MASTVRNVVKHQTARQSKKKKEGEKEKKERSEGK